MAVQLFADRFDTFVSVNLDAPGEGGIFRKAMPVKELFQAICLRKQVKAESGRTLLFLDEIQGCPEACGVPAILP